ncbi:hypothetical protein BS47DRAFT_729359 [Hydnum rufescens UP504]|uniref:Uncharacterized protein n=1 Tax=Hydnum rufescens UP504 TaxID=1448309 RepID=A0A9P6B1E4_9AGAM|nr:hypothetical protein BS47DRAFT_729359 [Hydnum rufescens UP504]
MQEMELPDLPPKTEQERLQEQARDELEQQLNESNRLVSQAKDKLAQAEKEEADAGTLRAQADLKVPEAKSKVEPPRLELQTDFETTLETERSERARERLEHQAKEEQLGKRLQEMEARLEALASANAK